MKLLSTAIICLLLFIACKQSDEVNIVYPEGGKPYLQNISPRDSNHYFLPEKKQIPDRDSFLAYDQKYSFDDFDEENISLSPPKEDIFRFTFGCGFCGKAAIIRLAKNSIIIKKNKGGLSNVDEDLKLLDSIEQEHYYVIKRYYPFTEIKYPEKYRKRYKIFFDSMIRVHPQLNDLAYFEQLRNKARVVRQTPKNYSEQRIPISTEKFKYFVDKLNNSHFWQRGLSNDCATAPMDGDGFVIEAATTGKYHAVGYDYCLGDDDKSDLRKMINELLNFIHFDLQAFYVEDFPKKKKNQ